MTDGVFQPVQSSDDLVPNRLEVQRFPRVFKKTNTGAIQTWMVTVKSQLAPIGEVFDHYGVLEIAFGQLDGKLQVSSDVIKVGKNPGKKNETTPVTQSIKEAESMFKKKLKEGYCESLEDTIEGRDSREGFDPMLAEKYLDRLDEIQWPIMVQPKLDGMRCCAVFCDGEVKLYSRKREPILTVPHIVQAIKDAALANRWYEKFAPGTRVLLDGELYNHELKEDFNEIMSMLKRKGVHPDSESMVQYHIYDYPSSSLNTFERKVALENLFEFSTKSLVMVPYQMAYNNDDVYRILDFFLEDMYEGAIGRQDGPYCFKRSKYLLKLKLFVDEEFEIVGMEEGRRNLMGRVGKFAVKLPDGRTFEATPKGTLAQKKEMFDNFSYYLGKMLTVRYHRRTPDGIPRHGSGRVRDYE